MMKERIQNLLTYITNKQHHQFRQNVELVLAPEFSTAELPDLERATRKN